MTTYSIRVNDKPVGRCLDRSWASAIGRARRDFGPKAEVVPVYSGPRIESVDDLVDAENGLTIQKIRGIS